MPRRNQVSRYIADNSFTLYTEKADRRITDLRNNCVGCLGPDRIVTPIRVQYVPPGTNITVVDEYVHKSRSFSGSDIRLLIVKDERGNIAEIAAYQFDSDIAKPYTGRLDRTTATVISHVDSFKRNKELRLSFCPASFARKSASPEAFLRDFQMQDEVDITVGSTLCDDGYLLAFKTLESYLTSRYYFSEWGLHGKWSDRKTKPVLARPKRRPPQLTLNACSMKLSDVRKSGSCPGPKCELSKLCN